MGEYDKWETYVIGQINFIKNTQNHPHRKIFIDYVIDSCDSAIEVGPGELIEYQAIRPAKEIDYTIVDVSDVFIGNCQKEYPEVHIVKCPMEEITLEKIGSKKDVIYGASVIEHSKDPRKAIKSMLSVAHHFHIVLFKWSYGGGLKATYYPTKNFWSTCFNIRKLLGAISEFGEIEYCDLVKKKNGKRIPFSEYKPKSRGNHRTGDYLVIHGKSI